MFSTTELDGTANDLFGDSEDLKDDAVVGDTLLLSLTRTDDFNKERDSGLGRSPDPMKDEAFLFFPLEEAKSDDLGRLKRFSFRNLALALTTDDVPCKSAVLVDPSRCISVVDSGLNTLENFSPSLSWTLPVASTEASVEVSLRRTSLTSISFCVTEPSVRGGASAPKGNFADLKRLKLGFRF